MAVILIVDDHVGIAEALAEIVRVAGCEPVIAGNGVAAIRHLASHRVDLMILDDHMPGMTGIDVLRTLQRTGELKMPVVMFSASDRSRDVAMELGADDFLLKTQFDELIEVILKSGCPPKVAVA